MRRLLVIDDMILKGLAWKSSEIEYEWHQILSVPEGFAFFLKEPKRVQGKKVCKKSDIMVVGFHSKPSV